MRKNASLSCFLKYTCFFNRLSSIKAFTAAVTFIDLFSNDYFTYFFQLLTLKVQNNQLTSLPCGVGKLTKLTKLECGENQLKDLPPEIGAFAFKSCVN